MINHARTLLLNSRAASLDRPGSAYVPDDFVPVPVGGGLQAARRVLFGTSPDAYMLNYRVAQLLGVVEATTLAEDLARYDRRIINPNLDLTLPAIHTPQVVSSASPADARITGQPEDPDASGITTFQFLVSNDDEDTVRVLQSAPVMTTSTTTVTRPGGLSSPAPLGGSGYSVRLASADSTAVWSVFVLNRPRRTPGDLIADLVVTGELAIAALFDSNVDSVVSRYATIWRNERDTPLRVAAVTLALIHQTELRRLRGGD